jgi:phospholipid/cholesterol/gamma-HCH transport system substrate-binding protein
MKRADDLLVGVVVLIGIAVTVAGSIWLSEVRMGSSDIVREARFRSAGQLQVGNPVLLRGVKIGRVEAVRLDSTARNQWVRVTLRLKGTEKLPADPVGIIFSATLFGDWAVQLLDRHDLPNDPDVRRQVTEAAQGAGRTWPGATLPDIGQLTAQAGRIAGDFTIIAERVQAAFDSSSAEKLRGAFRDFSSLSRTLATLASQQQQVLTRIGGNLDTGTASLARFAAAMERTAHRADSATDRDQLRRILSRADSASGDLRATAGDLRQLTAAARGQQEAFVRIVAHLDSIVGRVDAGQGTLGRLSRDTTLYSEAVAAIRRMNVLLDDVKANPRRYFQFSVF